MLSEIALACAFATLFITGSQSPRASSAETKFVPPQFGAALVFEPARFDKSAKAAGLPVADLWKFIEGIVRTEVTQLECVTILADPFPAGNLYFAPAFVLRYPTGTDARNQLAPILGGDVKNAKVGSIAYVRSVSYKLAEVEWAGYAVDERTLLVAPWPTLEEMLKSGAKERERMLAAQLTQADFGHDLTLVFTVPPVVNRYTEAQKRIEDPSYKEIKPILERLVTITISLDLGNDPVIRAVFQCDNATGADVVHDALKNLLAKAQEGYPAVRKDIAKTPPVEVWKVLVSIADAAMTKHNLMKVGNNVVLTTARPEHWKK